MSQAGLRSLGRNAESFCGVPPHIVLAMWTFPGGRSRPTDLVNVCMRPCAAIGRLFSSRVVIRVVSRLVGASPSGTEYKVRPRVMCRGRAGVLWVGVLANVSVVLIVPVPVPVLMMLLKVNMLACVVCADVGAKPFIGAGFKGVSAYKSVVCQSALVRVHQMRKEG